MAVSLWRRSLGLLVAAGLVACAPKEFQFEVKIVSSSCEPLKDSPFQGAQFLRVRVTGDGLLKPLDAIAQIGATTKSVKIPEIPAGKRRAIEVRAYDSDPATGTVISIGRTAPFDIPDVVPDMLPPEMLIKNVFMRRVGEFSAVASADDPNVCQRLQLKRAGHTATLLDDGSVLIAGGYNYRGPGQKQALADVEVFDPNTAKFRVPKTPRIELRSGVPLPKAFHTATKLKNGQVILWGGESYDTTMSAPTPTKIIVGYDPTVEGFFGQSTSAAPPQISRTRHSAVLDRTGKVLAVGGMTRGMTGSFVPAEPVEWYDPDKGGLSFVIGGNYKLPREGAVAAPFRDATYVAVAGGSTATAFTNEIVFFGYDANKESFEAQPAGAPRLADPGRRYASIAAMPGDALLVIGGFRDLNNTQPLASSELIANTSVGPGPALESPRAETCAVALQDGTVFVSGGTTPEVVGGPVKSDARTTLIKTSSSGGTGVLGGPVLPVARVNHTCTVLADGSVLVTGGVNRSAAGMEDVLQDAWIYTPKPVD